MRIDSRLYYGAILIMVTLAVLFAYLAVVTGEKEVRKIEVCSYLLRDDLNYLVYLSDNDLFEGEVLKNPHRIFPNITRSIVVSYSFSATCTNCSGITGNYEVYAVIKTRHWNKTVHILSGSFQQNYSLNLPLDLRKYWQIYDRISREVGFESSDAVLVLKFITHVESEHVKEIHQHPLTIPLNRKFADISTKQHTQKLRKVDHEEEVVSGRKLVLKYSSAVMSIALSLSAFVFTRKFKPKNVDIPEEEKLARKYRDIIVLGKSVTSGRVEVESFEELLKIAEFVNRPIVKIGKEFFVVSDGVTYTFRP